MTETSVLNIVDSNRDFRTLTVDNNHFLYNALLIYIYSRPCVGLTDIRHRLDIPDIPDRLDIPTKRITKKFFFGDFLSTDLWQKFRE